MIAASVQNADITPSVFRVKQSGCRPQPLACAKIDAMGCRPNSDPVA